MLAQAGLLDGYNCSAHWECLAALQEDYPRIFCNNNLFTFDRDRITCTGGDVALHMMLHLVADHYGAPLANAISDMFVCDRIRDSQEPQRLRMENNVFASQPKLASAVQLMEANIEEPIDLVDVAAYSGGFAPAVGALVPEFSRHYALSVLPKGSIRTGQTAAAPNDLLNRRYFVDLWF